MNALTPDTAFILAAGFGTRLRPLTNTVPKPMVEVGGIPMIEHALNKLSNVGVKICGVNTHYKAGILETYLKDRSTPQIKIFHEGQILDTGGGLKQALTIQPGIFKAPFFVLSGDSVWEDAPGVSSLEYLSKGWDPKKMDILMLLQPVKSMHVTKGIGDYDLSSTGQAQRSMDKSGAYMFTSIRINAPHIFEETPKEHNFSYLQLLDKAERQGRLYAIVHKGAWHHISTVDDLNAVNIAWSGMSQNG